jgi:aminoglycoside phosphotransferase family enzyme/predicted kinase
MVPDESALAGKEAAPRFAIEELLRASAYAHAVSELQLHETHLSWVILTGTLAYKIKKPVHLAFVDASSLARRLELCREELRLNRRLAADLYLGLVPIARDSGGLRVGGAGAPVEYAVCMRQFESSQELVALLARDEVTAAEIAQLGALIAQFHRAAAEAAPSATFEYSTQLREAVQGAIAVLRRHAMDAVDSADLEFLDAWCGAHLQSAAPQLHRREQSRRIRECHGDLHAGNIVRWHGALTPFDCLEFDPKLRFIDVLNDVAFLVMDLVGKARADLAAVFMNRYLECTGDYAGLPLLPLYAVYRAIVRAMVDAVGIDTVADQRQSYRERLLARMRTAREFAQRPAPLLLLMHGLSGSGKSWLSAGLIGPLAAIRIRSDVERKRLRGAARSEAGNDGIGRGLYAPSVTHQTYERLLESAQHCLDAGFNTIVDAAFLERAARSRFLQCAARRGNACLILDCQADVEILRQRLMKRAAGGTDPSDAGLEVLEQQLQDAQPLDPAERACCIDVRTAENTALDAALAAIAARRGPSLRAPAMRPQ